MSGTFTLTERLELAAYAVGLEYTQLCQFMVVPGKNPAVSRVWDPANDDGDALRLAAELGMTVEINRKHGRTIVRLGDIGTAHSHGRDGTKLNQSNRSTILEVAARRR